MIISIHQPDYIPYLGYFYKIACSDKFVFLDDVQFSSSNMHNWNTIIHNGEKSRLKIPVDYHFGGLLTDVRCKYELGWVEKHLSKLREAYRDAKFFNEVYPEIEKILTQEHSSLAKLNIAMNTMICRKLGFKAEFIISSEITKTGKKEDLVIDICRGLGADCYISGNGARDYQDEEHFFASGIELKYTDFEPKEYLQQSEEFIPNMSVIDYIMNCGWNNPFICK